jgi:succinate dehydrogenase/fumarate reductase cytochrome b subunit
MGEECPSERLVNEFIVYVTVITVIHISNGISVLLWRLRWFQQLFGMPYNPVGPMSSFSIGILFGILFVHANQMIPLRKLSVFNELMIHCACV